MLTLVKSNSPFLLGEYSSIALKALQDTAGSEKREVVSRRASDYISGDINYSTAASLLGDSPILVIKNAETLTDDLITDIKNFAANAASYTNPADVPDVIIEHSGAVRGKAMIDAMKKACSLNPKLFKVIEKTAPKSDKEKHAFVKERFASYGKTISNDAANILIKYEGDDLGILIGYIKQLSSDCGDMKNIDLKYINQFFSGIKQVKPWDIINAALDGNLYSALSLYRHAISSGGVSSVTIPLVSMMLTNVNDIVKVSSMGARGMSAKDLGKAPWLIDQIKARIRLFSAAKLQKTYSSLMLADKASKGFSSDGGVLAFEDVLRVLSTSNDK